MDRYIINTDLNDDLILSVNTGGTQFQALRIVGEDSTVAIPILFSLNGRFGNLSVTTGSFDNAIFDEISATTGSFDNAIFDEISATTGSFTSSLVATTGSFGNLLATTGSFTSLVTPTATFTTANITLVIPSYTSSSTDLTLTAISPDLVVLNTGTTSLKLPGDVSLGRTFKIINNSASAITIRSSSNATLALVIAGKTLYTTALQTNPTTASHWLIEGSSKQIEKGTAVVASNARTSTAYGAFTTNVTLTFTAASTGRYKIYTQASVDLSVTTSTYGLKLEATSGSPTAYWNPQNATSGTLITGTSRQQVLVQRIDSLVAGTSYTYALYGASTSGTLTLRGDLAEIVILAEFIE